MVELQSSGLNSVNVHGKVLIKFIFGGACVELQLIYISKIAAPHICAKRQSTLIHIPQHVNLDFGTFIKAVWERLCVGTIASQSKLASVKSFRL